MWPGGVDAAVTALGGGARARLLFVDLDGLGYPAGAIHELAAVCEVGTVVVAFGTATSARYSREVLLSGVSDYLVKPLEAEAVREAALRAGVGGADSGARVTAFAGGGGSGATTLAAGVAVTAAAARALRLGARPLAALLGAGLRAGRGAGGRGWRS